MAVKDNRPEIRFKGFNDMWSVCELGEMADNFEYGLNAAAINYDGVNKYIRITDIDDETHEFNTVALTSPGTDLSLADNYRLQEGDLLFARTGASVGKTYRYKNSDGLIYYAGFLIRARLKPIFDIEFVFQNTLTNKYNNFIRLTSQRSGQPGVNAQEYSDFKIMVPVLSEQKQIGKLFSNFDSLITLHQRKYDKLIQVKKAMLGKMFPKDGADVPEIRFKGFTDKWVRRELGVLTDIIDGDRGNNYPNGNEFQERGHTLFLNASNVTINGFRFDVNQFISEDKSNCMGNGKLILDDLILTSRGSIGHIALYDVNIQRQIPFARINSGMLILRKKNFIVPCFLTHFLKSPLGNKQIDLISFGSAQPQLTKKDVSNYMVSFPNDSIEQEKIADYFQKLDNLITLQEHELEKLKNIKKACLEKMFV